LGERCTPAGLHHLGHDLRRGLHRLAPQPVPGAGPGRRDPHRHPAGCGPLRTVPLPGSRRRGRGGDRGPRAPAHGDGLSRGGPVSTPATQTGSGEFASLVAVVTGGASGIGAAVAQRLHDGGARVAILDQAAVAAPSGAAAEAAETTWLELAADVSDQTSVSTAVEQVISTWGRLDVLVNNAGIGAQGTVADGTEEQWHQVLDVNLMGMVRTARAALEHLRASPAAAIVN